MSISTESLTSSQKIILDRIVKIGIARGEQQSAILLAVQFANAESTFNKDAIGPTNGTTIKGTFQYSDSTWIASITYAKNHEPNNSLISGSSSELRDNLDAQITIMFSDLSKYKSEFDSKNYPGAYKPDAWRSVDTITLGHDVYNDFSAYAYLRHNTNPNEVHKVINNVFDKYNAKYSFLITDTYYPSQNITVPTNASTFDLSTDPSGLNPTTPNSLGSSSHGWGLAAGGAGYAAVVSSTYLNNNGLVNTALGNAATGDVRIGNHSLSDTPDFINGLRVVAFGNTEQINGTLHFTSGISADTLTQEHNIAINQTINGVVTSFTGTVHYDDAGRAIAITPDNGQTALITMSDGSIVKLDSSVNLVMSTNQTQDGQGNWTAAGWYLQPANDSGQLIAYFDEAGNLIFIDPLSLDAGNDGILISANPVNFDLNADGSPEAVRWTAPTDPLLVLDGNGDGRINHGSELVDLTDPSTGSGQAAGNPINLFNLDGDVNGIKDGVLNANDSAFAQLQLWADRNQDGYASAEERQGLAVLGIQSIDLNPIHLQTSTSASPIAGQTGIKGVVATYTDGSHKTLWDVPLQTTGSIAPIVRTAYGTSGSIDKISSNGQTALKAISSFGVAINLQGSGADQAIGSFGNDTLTGTSGNDWLIGGADNTFIVKMMTRRNTANAIARYAA